MPGIFSTADVGRLLNVKTWKVRRLYEDGTLPDPPRVGRQRAITSQAIPQIVQALGSRGWLSVETPVLAESDKDA